MSTPLGYMSKIKNFLWPIYKGEYKKFIPMLFIFFLISFNYNILRAAKDTLVITAPNSGAEAIPSLKICLILPAALLITYIFTKISNKFSRDKVFYLMIGIFLGFFVLFALVLYPAREALHPTSFVNNLKQILPSGFNGILSLIQNWTFTLFYVMSELWGTVILTVLFWGFANDVTTIDEAKRFYALFGLGANIATIISGRLTILFSSNNFNPNISYGQSAWDQSILFLTIAITVIGVLISVIFYFLNKKLPTEPKQTKVKEKQSLKKNFSYLTKSKYLIYIALIVLCYNITINLMEVTWKNQVKSLYPNSSDFNAYMGQVMIITGVISSFTALLISGNFLRKFSWTFNALLPPVAILITGIGFFSFFIFNQTSLIYITGFIGSTPLIMSVFFGTMQNCIARASKFTLFDATKEIAYIPLDKNSRVKGKAAIDGVGSRIGKSGGSVIHQSLLLIFSTLTASAPYIGFISLTIIIIWIFAVKKLGRQFKALTREQENIKFTKKTLEDMQAISNKKLQKNEEIVIKN